MRVFLLAFLFSMCGALAETKDPRYAIDDNGSLIFGAGLKLQRFADDGEWRYLGAQQLAGRELLRFSFVRAGLREVTVDLSYSEKLSSGAFEENRVSGFLTGFALREGLSKGKEEKAEVILTGAKAKRVSRLLTDKKRTFHFSAYFIARSPHTTIWFLSQDVTRATEYRSQIEKL